MTKKKIDILIVGVGGQGVLLASEIVAEVAILAGLDVKKSEVHGMAQRGGVVSSHIRIDEKVYSPMITAGQADILLSFEQAEALRAIEWLKPEGHVVVSQTRIVPAIVTSSKEHTYPDNPIAELRSSGKKVIDVEADRIAAELGNPRLVNTILLGVASNYLPFERAAWEQTMKKKIKPRFVDLNLQAFARGVQIRLVTESV